MNFDKLKNTLLELPEVNNVYLTDTAPTSSRLVGNYVIAIPEFRTHSADNTSHAVTNHWELLFISEDLEAHLSFAADVLGLGYAIVHTLYMKETISGGKPVTGVSLRLL